MSKGKIVEFVLFSIPSVFSQNGGSPSTGSSQSSQLIYLNPGEAAPAQVIAGPVKRDVKGVKITSLPIEEP